MTQKINKIEVMSLAKIYGATIGFLVLILGVVGTLLVAVFGSAIAPMIGLDAGAGFVGIVISGLIMTILAAIFYSIIGFISGAVGALLYNFVAKKVGPIEIELE
ncbi:MAG: hypothetical protein KAS30_03745 [Candidatus Diapherotrites archaeon]|nr:hypothetical protein [Candidatus Diapherotrites archaeon]